MKYCLEFGNRGGTHVDNLVLSSRGEACKIAASLVLVFSGDNLTAGASPYQWLEPIRKNAPRVCWASTGHFVALSRLDGAARGAAAAFLWRAAPYEEKPSLWLP